MKNMKEKIWFRSIKAALGLIFYSFGLFLTVKANIGVAPWDVFALGFVNQFSITLGQATMMISVVVVIVDLILKEKIGIGTLLDAIIVGAFLDIFEMMGIVPNMTMVWTGLVAMTIGLFIMALGQYFYMDAALCCGPRDTLLVGLGKLVPKVPIGAVLIVIEAVVLIIGWILGGQVGIGTLYSVVAAGAIMQLIFKLLKFEPRNVIHSGIAIRTKQADA